MKGWGPKSSVCPYCHEKEHLQNPLMTLNLHIVKVKLELKGVRTTRVRPAVNQTPHAQKTLHAYMFSEYFSRGHWLDITFIKLAGVVVSVMDSRERPCCRNACRHWFSLDCGAVLPVSLCLRRTPTTKKDGTHGHVNL